MKCSSRFLAAVLSFGALLLAPANGNAGLITGVSSSNSSAVAASFVSSTFNGAAGSNTIGGSVTINLDVKQLHVPVVLTFTIAAGGLDSGGVLRSTSASTNYTLTLNVKNSIPASAGNNQLDFKGFDLTAGLITQGTSQLLAAVSPTSDVFAVEYTVGNRNITGGYRWGGLAGGGATLAAGATAVNTVVWGIAYDNQSAATAGLNFTANPEPATLLLGSLIMAPAAWVVRRRRKAAAAELEAAPV